MANATLKDLEAEQERLQEELERLREQIEYNKIVINTTKENNRKNKENDEIARDISKKEYLDKIVNVFINCINYNSNDLSEQVDARVRLLIIESNILNSICPPFKNTINPANSKYKDLILQRKIEVRTLLREICNPNTYTVAYVPNTYSTYNSSLKDLVEKPRSLGYSGDTRILVGNSEVFDEGISTYLFKNLLLPYYVEDLQYPVKYDKTGDVIPYFRDLNPSPTSRRLSRSGIETLALYKKSTENKNTSSK